MGFNRRHARRAILAVAAIAAGAMLTGCQTAAMDPVYAAAAQPQAGDKDRGRASFRQGQYGLAEQHFRRAAETRADDPEIWMGLAAAYDRIGRFDQADRAYEQLLKLAGRHPRVVSNMGYSHYLRGDRQQALALYAEARASLPDDPVLLANIAKASN